MAREIVINATKHESRIAVIDEGQVAELWVERHRHRTIVGNIYKGRVTKVLPGMQSAFVELGLERDAFLYVSDVVEDFEDRTQFGELHQAFAVRAEVEELELAAAVFEGGVGGYQLAEAAGIDVVDILHIEDDAELALLDEVANSVAEGGGGGTEDQAAGEVEHHDTIDFPVDEFERHGGIPFTSMQHGGGGR